MTSAPTEILEQIFELAVWKERSTLRELFKFDFPAANVTRGAIYHTIPRAPTILASTCRRWRIIALNLPRLWNFLRVPTVETYRAGNTSRSCIAGRSTFHQAIHHVGNAECEVVLGHTDDWDMLNDHLRCIPRSQISIVNIVSPYHWLDSSQVPTARVFRLFNKTLLNRDNRAKRFLYYILPVSALACAKELECHHALPAVIAPILSVTSFSLNLLDNAYFPDLCDALANFPNVITLVIRTEWFFHTRLPQSFTPLHHACISTLSVTVAIIPSLCASLQRGTLSLPSLTHFMLRIDPYYDKESWVQLQPLFVNVTRFDIRVATQQNCGSNIRQLLDLMPLLQQLSVFGVAVSSALDALLVAPIKQIDKLVILDSETDGSDVNSYYDSVRSETVDGAGASGVASVLFVNCLHILPHILQRFSTMDNL